MPTRKVSGPSLFCEWVVGTTIPSSIKPPPRPKPQPKPKFRDVVKVHVTTDDESEEDTVRITYPRTSRTMLHRLAPPPEPTSETEEATEEIKEESKEETKEEVKEEASEESVAEEVVKKVRFEDSTTATPIKSALKKTKTPPPESDETSDSGTEAKTDSEAESSDDSGKAPRTKKLKKKKQKPASETDSEYDSDPHPTCKCESCAKGREMLSKVCKKHEKSNSDTGTETSEPEIDTSSVKGKKGNGGNGKKGGGKKGKDLDTQAETSDSSKDASGSEPEKPTKGKSKAKDKGAKKEEPKSEESDTAAETFAETSDSQPETPPETKKQPRKKEAKKGDQAKQQKKQAPKKKKNPEAEAEPGPEAEPQPESGGEADDEAEEKVKEEPTSSKKQQRKKEKKVPLSPPEQPPRKSSRPKGEKKKKAIDNNPEGFPPPHVRRPNLIQPVRAEVVQTERVVEGPLDPPPNAYYDPSHNVVRVYYGPVYGNHHGYALYPGQGDARPVPVGTPHPTQNPYLYALDNQQLQPPKPPPQPQIQSPNQGYGYSNVPVTQGMPVGQWNDMTSAPGFPHVPPPDALVANQGSQDMKADDGPYMSGALPPPSSNNKDGGSFGNTEANDPKEPKNPYYNPSRTRSQFSAYGSAGRRQVSKETHNSVQNGDQGESKQTWGNDGAGDQSGDWQNQNNEPNGWGGGSSHSQQQNNPDSWGNRSNPGSQRSTGTQRKQGSHWGEDTFPQPRYGPNDWNNNEESQPQRDNGPVTNGWEENAGVGDGYPDGTKSNVMPGTWIDTPAASCPTWGDTSCAVDTKGAADQW